MRLEIINVSPGICGGFSGFRLRQYTFTHIELSLLNYNVIMKSYYLKSQIDSTFVAAESCDTKYSKGNKV